MGGAAKTAARRKIFKSTTSAPAAGWGMMPKRISSRCVPAVIESGTSIGMRRREIRSAASRGPGEGEECGYRDVAVPARRPRGACPPQT